MSTQNSIRDHRYFMVNKPPGMESQFVPNYPSVLLSELNYDFPPGIHAIGRLDKNSEGLLLLTTNKKITRLLFSSSVPHARSYLVQVRHKVSETTLERLRKGVKIKIENNYDYVTQPCDVEIVHEPQLLVAQSLDTSPYIVHTWLKLTISEGRYHQVRKMVSAAGHKCMRLIRIAIEDLSIGSLAQGEVKEIHESDFFQKLKLGLEKQGAVLSPRDENS